MLEELIHEGVLAKDSADAEAAKAAAREAATDSLTSASRHRSPKVREHRLPEAQAHDVSLEYKALAHKPRIEVEERAEKSQSQG